MLKNIYIIVRQRERLVGFMHRANASGGVSGSWTDKGDTTDSFNRYAIENWANSCSRTLGNINSKILKKWVSHD